MRKNFFFYPLEVNFNNFFNTYFAVSISSSFSFRSFQPKFYEFIKFKTLSIFSTINVRKFNNFISFQNPANLFRPSLFSSFLAFEKIFQNERFFFINERNFSFFQYNFPFFYSYCNFSKNIFFKFLTTDFCLPFVHLSKFNIIKFAVNTPFQKIDVQSFSFLPVFPTRNYTTLNIGLKNLPRFPNLLFKSNLFKLFGDDKNLNNFFFFQFFKLLSKNAFFGIDDMYNNFSTFFPFNGFSFENDLTLLKKTNSKLIFDDEGLFNSPLLFSNFSNLSERSQILKKFFLICPNLIFLISLHKLNLDFSFFFFFTCFQFFL